MSTGATPMHYAAGTSRTSNMSCLLDRGADIDARMYGGQTPLHVATQLGRISSMSYLIDNGAAINATDERGRTPLHLAVASKNIETTSLLMALDADHTIADIRNDTVSTIAMQNKSYESDDDFTVALTLINYSAIKAPNSQKLTMKCLEIYIFAMEHKTQFSCMSDDKLNMRQKDLQAENYPPGSRFSACVVQILKNAMYMARISYFDILKKSHTKTWYLNSMLHASPMLPSLVYIRGFTIIILIKAIL